MIVADRLYNGCEVGELVSIRELRTLASKWLLLWRGCPSLEEQALTIYQVEAFASFSRSILSTNSCSTRSAMRNQQFLHQSRYTWSTSFRQKC